MPGQRETASLVLLGDLDSDGDLDALVGNKSAAIVWINQGGVQGEQEGVFAQSVFTIAGAQTRAVFLANLDSDGDLDLPLVKLKFLSMDRSNGVDPRGKFVLNW